MQQPVGLGAAQDAKQKLFVFGHTNSSTTTVLRWLTLKAQPPGTAQRVPVGVTVDEEITPLTSATKPCVPVSRHTTPQ